MRHLRATLVTFLAVLAPIGCSSPSRPKPTPKFFAPVQVTPEVSMDAAAFGLKQSVFAVYDVEETGRVPLKPGIGYGWCIHLRTSKPKVAWKEEFILPEAPDQWGKPDAKISEDRRISVTEKTEAPIDGWISNGWSVAEGDPKGTYVMKVYIEGALARTFEFVVE